MYDFTLFAKARAHYGVAKLPFLDALREKVKQEKPYQGLRLLHNTPLTLATLFKIEVLALGGAHIVTTCITSLPPEKRAVSLLKQANFSVQIPHQFNEEFDFHLDCCGELHKLAPPKIGTVELTQTGSKIYKDKAPSYPLLSVDDSKLKVLETFFGTGDGFSRAVYELVGSNMHDKPFVIFGYGKVGRGILYALKKITHDITVIDINPQLNQPGIHFIHGADKEAVREAITRSYCAVTATGVKHLLSDYYQFSKADFKSCLLTNMGAEDEYGPLFDVNDVAFNKKPINFSINEPTAYRYLDPIFYAHNLGIDLILSKQINFGYNAFPEEHANQILAQWQAIYGESLHEALAAEMPNLVK